MIRIALSPNPYTPVYDLLSSNRVNIFWKSVYVHDGS